jgi:2-phospho-L-lactate/phosphoenolpyruvate guanylyltransferase
VRWTVLLPTKALPEAKSRLATSSADAQAHARLVRAIRADTVAAARSARNVARIVIVADRPGMDAPEADEVIVQSAPGLNAALREGARHAAQRWPEDGIAALVGDLPAMRPDELADALESAARTAHAYVTDMHGTGTTLLTARAGQHLGPSFGLGSAARHEVAATQLAAGPGLRHDVDTEADLRRALTLGVGPATLAVTAPETFGVHLDSA